MNAQLQRIEIFVYRGGRSPMKIEANGDEPIAKILAQAGICEPDLLVFVGEPHRHHQDGDDHEDDHDPVNPDDASCHDGGHVHCHHCRRIAVTVHYRQHEGRHRFSPAATIASVTAWARLRFKLSDVDAEKLVLKFDGKDEYPDQHQHLSELVHAPHCDLCLDLVPDERING